MTDLKKQTNVLPFLAAFLGNMIWGFGFVLESLALSVEGSTPTAVLSIRFLLATILLVILAIVRGERLFVWGKAWKTLILFALAQPAYYLFEGYGIQHSNATFSGVVLSVSPIFGILFAAIFLREYPTWKQVLFSALPILGVIIMSVSGKSIGVVEPIGIVFLFFTCIASGAYKTLNRGASKNYSTFERTYAVMLVTCVFFATLALFETKGDFRPYGELLKQPAFTLPVIALAVFSSIGANLLCNYATGLLSVTKVTAFGAVCTIFSAVGGVLFLNEPMPPAFVIGTALVVLGVFLLTISKENQSVQNPVREEKKTMKIEDLKPRQFFRFFAAIAAIPHGSGKEQQLADWICAFAKEREFPCEQDEKGNVFMRVPATRGYENEPPVLMQAHMDMIWAKKPEVDFDFETQPLKLIVEDGYLHADGTTLGADNAVGMATMLGIADAGEKAPHPPLELLFTVQEETGLHGIRAFDMSKITARRMLNMDCGHTHELCLASPGKVAGEIRMQFSAEENHAPALRVELTGGFDGHLGGIMRNGRACADSALGEILSGLPCRLVSIEQPSGNCHAAVTAVLVPEDAEAARQHMTARFETYAAKHREKDPDLQLAIYDDTADAALTKEDSARIAAMLQILSTGVREYFADEIGGPALTCAMQTLILKDGDLSVFCLTRGYDDEKTEHFFATLQAALAEHGITLPLNDRYSGWPGLANSPFRDQFIASHRKLCGEEPSYYRIMGGIEVGMITGAIPEMDAVGYAPTANGAHTPRERLLIDEVQPFWDVLLDVLATKTK